MNRLHVYTVSGKGKTTAAMGLALRSLGHGNKVLVGQFLKDGTSSELRALSARGADVYLPPLTEGFVAGMNEERQYKTIEDHASYIDLLQQKIGQLQPKTIILDELGMVQKSAAIALISRFFSPTSVRIPRFSMARASGPSCTMGMRCTP